MARDNKGFVVVFRLGCLDMIGERFGWEAIHDCLMAVSAYLTHSLHSNDIIYHWSDSSLLAIMQGRANEQMLSAELNRIAAHNRDITVQIDGRTIMLRIPLDFDITVISRLRSADDLYKLAPECAVNR
jgi:GGDEF domain-containing protein